MAFGVSIYTICIGNVSTIIATIDTKAAILNQKLEVLHEYAQRVEIEPQLAVRIQRYLENDSK